MDAQKLMERITFNPDICHGKPTIRNSRYMVESLLELMASGMTMDEILEDFPGLEREDLQACLMFAVRLTQLKHISKVVA
jgi:uncharacterized protein (DUF433 family)